MPKSIIWNIYNIKFTIFKILKFFWKWIYAIIVHCMYLGNLENSFKRTLSCFHFSEFSRNIFIQTKMMYKLKIELKHELMLDTERDIFH